MLWWDDIPGVTHAMEEGWILKRQSIKKFARLTRLSSKVSKSKNIN